MSVAILIVAILRRPQGVKNRKKLYVAKSNQAK